MSTEYANSKLFEPELRRRCQRNVKKATEILEAEKVEDTKTNYIGYFQHYLWFAQNAGYSERRLPADPQVLILWYAEKTEIIGSATSFRSWQASIGYVHDLLGLRKDYLRYPLYTRFTRALQRMFDKPKDRRLPFTNDHLIRFTQALGVNPATRDTIAFDALLMALLVQLMYFTASRPNELIDVPRNKRKNGISTEDIVIFKRHPLRRSLIKIIVRSIKNAATFKDHKIIPFGVTTCGNPKCPHRCDILDPFGLFITVLRRMKEVRGYSPATKNPIMRWKCGRLVKYRDVRKICHAIVQKNQITDGSRYTPYSMRIGGTTRASLAGINHSIILDYVHWSTNNMPDSGRGYIRAGDDTLKNVPFDMIHGVKGHVADPERSNQIWDPWELYAARSASKKQR